MKPMVRLFMIVWDDEQGIVVPMGWDNDCAGAVCAIGHKDKVALFSDRKSARRAIDISAKFAALCKAQGKPANDDFLGEFRKNLRVVECEPNPAGVLPSTSAGEGKHNPPVRLDGGS